LLILLHLAIIGLGGTALQPPDLETVLLRAGDYVESYERELGMVIAREEYVQTVPAAGAADIPAAPGIAGNIRTPYQIKNQERRLLSDYMMVRLPSAGDQWVGFRAVIEVDGRPVRDRAERMQNLFTGSQEEALEQWRKLSAESARYNIGSVNRNTNVPTFALLVLRDENRALFDFEHVGDDRVEGVNTWVLSYRERGSPALITDEYGKDVLTYGRLWVDPNDGRVVRSEVRTGDDNSALRTEMTVSYRPHEELGIWVPHEMKEQYRVRGGRIDATAKYSDFQRFNVSVDTEISK
jgi:hypothetical protein